MVVCGKLITISVPDQRQTNIQSTKTLYDLMIFFFDKKFDAKFVDIKKRLNGAGQSFLERYILVEPNSQLKRIAEETKMIQNNSIGERVFQESMNYQSELHREIFQELILLFKRKNELSGKRTLSWDD